MRAAAAAGKPGPVAARTRGGKGTRAGRCA
jgi:hypothetical protein